MTEYVCEIKQDYPGIPYEHDEFSGTLERREEIVRCRDCIWHDREDGDCARCAEEGFPSVEPDGFCAWGRRRES